MISHYRKGLKGLISSRSLHCPARTRTRTSANARTNAITITATCNANANAKAAGLIGARRSSSSYQYEYPTRTEAPIITRSKANTSSNANANTSTNTTNTPQIQIQIPANETDHFDDEQKLTPSQRQSILTKQKSTINSKLPSSFAINTTPPDYIPPNLPQDELSTPRTQLTTLSNGLRVASQETYGQVSTFGIISNCGSRLEQSSLSSSSSTTGSSTTGSNHLMELLAFSTGSHKFDATTYQNSMDKLGGVSFASSSREQFLYCIDVLRPNIDSAMDMMQDVVLRPNIDNGVVEEMKRVIEFQWMDIMPEILLSEGLQMAGYGPISVKDKDGNGNGGQVQQQQQQLGKPHFCPLDALPNINAQTIINFRNKYLLNPKSMVIAGAGIQHDHLVSLAEKYFGHLQDPNVSTSTNPNEAPTINDNNNDNGIIHSVYTGGSHLQTMTTPDGFIKAAIAFPTGGWHSTDLVPSCVLQTLLGGGNSFSAGGPGKGMYSRLYRQVLNRYYWAESCEAFTSFHEESGLLGISGSSIPSKAGDMTRVLAENLLRLGMDLVEDEELDRARNMLKCNVLTQLESRLVLFEDVGRQILTYNKREDSKDMCAKIDAVTKEDLRTLVRDSIRGRKPTLCAVGDDISQIPAFEEVERWFKNL